MKAATSRARPPHLLRRGDTYYFRMRVPRDLVCRVGASEVRRSLGVSRLSEARLLAPEYGVRIREAFRMISAATLTQSQAMEIIAKCFADLASEADGGFKPTTAHPDWEVSEQRQMSSDALEALERQVQTGAIEPDTWAWAERYLRERQSVDLGGGSDSLVHKLVVGLVRARAEQQRLFQFRLDELLLPYQPTDPLFRSQGLASTVEAVPPSPAPSLPVGPTMSELAARYLQAKQGTWTVKTYRANESRLRLVVEHLGPDRRASTVTPADISSYRDGVLRLRSNHHIGAGKSFLSRQTDNPTNRIHPKTAKLILESCKTFFKWAKGCGQIAINPALDVPFDMPKTQKGMKARRPFTADELKKIFSAPPFMGRKSIYRRLEPGPLRVQDAYFWIPLLSFYSGARLGELVQLHMDDIHLDGPIPYLDVNEANGGEVGSGTEKHIKSEAGVRMVPIHPDLLALGFKEWVQARMKAHKAKKRLFFEIAFGKDGQASTTFSKWFARFLDSVGLSDPTLVFHSFRHGMEDIFRDALVPQYMIDAVIGHSEGKVSQGYGVGPSMEIKYEAVKSLKLPVSVPAILAQTEALKSAS